MYDQQKADNLRQACRSNDIDAVSKAIEAFNHGEYIQALKNTSIVAFACYVSSKEIITLLMSRAYKSDHNYSDCIEIAQNKWEMRQNWIGTGIGVKMTVFMFACFRGPEFAEALFLAVGGNTDKTIARQLFFESLNHMQILMGAGLTWNIKPFGPIKILIESAAHYLTGEEFDEWLITKTIPNSKYPKGGLPISKYAERRQGMSLFLQKMREKAYSRHLTALSTPAASTAPSTAPAEPLVQVPAATTTAVSSATSSSQSTAYSIRCELLNICSKYNCHSTTVDVKEIECVLSQCKNEAMLIAVLDSRGGRNATPLMVAVYNGIKGVVDILLKAYPNDESRHAALSATYRGKALADLADSRGHHNLAKTLRDVYESKGSLLPQPSSSSASDPNFNEENQHPCSDDGDSNDALCFFASPTEVVRLGRWNLLELVTLKERLLKALAEYEYNKLPDADQPKGQIDAAAAICKYLHTNDFRDLQGNIESIADEALKGNIKAILKYYVQPQTMEQLRERISEWRIAIDQAEKKVTTEMQAKSPAPNIRLFPARTDENNTRAAAPKQQSKCLIL